MPKTTTSVTQPRQSSFFPLLTGFFTYLFLLTRPHKRRLFMAGLVRKYYRDSTARTVLSTTDIFLFSFVITFAIAVLIGMSVIGTTVLPLLRLDAYRYAFGETVLYTGAFLFFSIALYRSGFYGDKRSFFLRYSYYSQTPSFQNPTKRRQILLLDTVTRYGTRWCVGGVLFLLVFLFTTTRFVSSIPSSTLLSALLGAFFLFVILILPIISPLTVDSVFASVLRKLLYNLHIRRYGPIPKELTDIVTQAYEIYPQVTT
ncbi:hypothetical protein [Tropheryma whipplei]|uniref:hypothetical protein n=1 Tax=Tropheryma whipplei TaxID=2039 RepID=UPI000000C8CC|nr:hypothetical protein [Tropheryma whipplei]CAD67267.1 putative membrane protein [Tropheryma whipplei TW08/27]